MTIPLPLEDLRSALEQLHGAPVSADDRISELDLDSLALLDWLGELEERFGVELEELMLDHDFGSETTVRDLHAVLVTAT